MHARNTLLLAAALGGGLALSSAAQTGRIAMASHAGRISEEGDNFGAPPARIEQVIDSLVYQNDTLVISYTRYRTVLYHADYHAEEAELKKKPWQLRNYQIQYYRGQYQQQKWEEAVAALGQRYPRAKLVGFDKQSKKHSGNKPAGRIQTFPKRPFQYSYWRGLATVAALGAVGWLLGRKSKTV